MSARALLIACWMIVVCSPMVVSAQQSAQGSAPAYPKAVLSKPYAAALGDMVALSVSEFLTALRAYGDPPTIAVYDRDSQKVAVLVYGSRSGLDGAKGSLDQLRAAMQPRLALIGNVYQVTLSEHDLGYVYYHEGKEVVRWEEGKYTVASE